MRVPRSIERGYTMRIRCFGLLMGPSGLLRAAPAAQNRLLVTHPARDARGISSRDCAKHRTDYWPMWASPTLFLGGYTPQH